MATIATLVRGVTYKKEDARSSPTAEHVALIRATNITGSGLTLCDFVYVPESCVSDDQRLVHGDIVIASSSGSKEVVGKAGQLLMLWSGSFGAFCTAIRPEPLLNARYLGYYFQTRKYREWVSDSSSGSNINNLKSSELATHVVPVPGVAEQTRIVEKLEELLSDLDAGVAELKAAQKKLAKYRQSLLRAAVEGTLGASCLGYPQRSLGELVVSIGQGWSPKCEDSATIDDETWAVIKTTAIQPLAFDGVHNKRLPNALRPREHLELKVGDLLVTRAGPRSRVGITCLVRKTKKRLILCDKAYRLRCDEALIRPDFLELALNAPHIANQIDALKTGINDSGLNLTQDRFFTLMIPVPTLEEQARVIESIEASLLIVVGHAAAIELALKQSTAQRKNILQAAFSGQLVPQDPNDEPASVLLARIRAEREARGATRARRGRVAKESA